MAKRGYKLQEFVAHASNVKCLKIGTKSGRLLVTGGEDHKVNLWAIGKPNSLLSLSGHTSPVESVTIDSAEVLVLSGAFSGAIKLWDLEEAKVVRTITGHRTNCTAVEFHPFGEFFASGSSDTNLKIWDIRKKGCIHTYKGHTRGISTIRFTPDGRWVVTGGEDNVVKLWDLTAGKLLHEFKFHGGRIRSIDFHPHEFLLATGSADRTVKFWDLETFELIGSSKPEATGVRAMTFHPDGRTLFCGLDETLKVFSWEPIRCHDAVDMGWSTLGDLRIHQGKLMGCSYHQNSVGVWVVDVSLIGPYAAGVMSRSNGHTDPKYDLGLNQSVQQQGSSVTSHTALLTAARDFDTKETLRRSLSQNSIESNCSAPRKIEPVYDTKEILSSSTTFNFRGTNPPALKKNPMIDLHARSGSQAISRPVVVPRNSSMVENATVVRKEIPTAESTPPVMVFSKPTHLRKHSNVKDDMDRQLIASESLSLSGKTNGLDSGIDHNFQFRFIANAEATESSESNHTNIRSTAEKFQRIVSLDPPSTPCCENDADSLDSSRVGSVKYVKGVAVELGRTRSLVERWERRERSTSSEAPAISASSDAMPETDTLPSVMKGQPQTSQMDLVSANDEDAAENIMQNHDLFLSVLQSRLTKLQPLKNRHWQHCTKTLFSWDDC
ncbi:katanin p80 WD40 repeat-containing subunit B1 homolog KTN80.4-like isoform X2 [Magnolia sinica]|uniref:katanin p80 WD40 repeat-containing subunit B1 homolog KTN80.4-like isoform X2 n=1 Tax=Magnolia sinica TaxID=86752 RepID=UPI00265B645A|nr:katanin p80 WD40 repeat-containing subunit B1 homolog KTN80.4-like isoform X2 [Magnolia sinica]